MQRFLVCLIRNPDETAEIPISYQVFPLKFATTPDEVITPNRTEMFFFREEESLEELQKSLALFKLGKNFTSFFGGFSSKDSLYFYGEIVTSNEDSVFVLTRNFSIAVIPIEVIQNKAIIIVEP